MDQPEDHASSKGHSLGCVALAMLAIALLITAVWVPAALPQAY